MKPIYDLFNDIDMDSDQLEEIKLDDIEMKKLKDNVHKKIKNKDKHKKFRNIAASVAVITCIGILGFKPIFAETNFASGIIERLNYSKNPKGLEDFTTVINKTVTDKDISITLESITMDDNLLNIGYKIYSPNKTIKNDAESKIFSGLSVKIDGEILRACSGGKMKRLDNNNVELLKTLNIENKKIPKSMDMSISFDELLGVKGKWYFNFKVEKEKIYSKIKNIRINKDIQLSDSKINIEKLSISPISTTLTYTGTSENSTTFKHFIILDDKGNQIGEQGNNFSDDKGNIQGTHNYDVIYNKGIKKLTIIPSESMDIIGDSKDKAKKLQLLELKNDNLPIELKQTESNKIIVNDVSFSKDKVVINYVCKGSFPVSQSYRLYLYDENKKELEEIWDGNSTYTTQGTFTKTFKLNNSKKYYIGTDDMSDIKFYENDKIEIDLTK